MNLNLLKLLAVSTDIPMCLVNGEKEPAFFPDEWKDIYTEDYIKGCCRTLPENLEDAETLIICTVSSCCYICLLSDKSGNQLIVGPVPCILLAKDDIARMTEFHTFESNRNAMQRLMMAETHASVQRFAATAFMAEGILRGVQPNVRNYSLRSPAEPEMHYKEKLTLQLKDARENMVFHTQEEYEMRFYDAVKAGDLLTLQEYMQQPIPGPEGVLSTDNIRQRRYMFVTTSALLARAAMAGGVPYDRACSMADSYCRQMDAAKEVGEIMALLVQMTVDFINEVRQYMSMNTWSRVTKDACKYVHEHLHEQISVEEMSKAIIISPNRLANHFRTDLGMTPMEYVRREKMKEAAQLLKYTSHTISEISNLLGYSSQSYFTVCFKRQYGMTPAEYR